MLKYGYYTDIMFLTKIQISKYKIYSRNSRSVISAQGTPKGLIVDYGEWEWLHSGNIVGPKLGAPLLNTG